MVQWNTDKLGSTGRFGAASNAAEDIRSYQLALDSFDPISWDFYSMPNTTSSSSPLIPTLSVATGATTSTSLSGTASPTRPLQPRDAPLQSSPMLESQLQHMIAYLRAMGFQSFDALATIYYTGLFGGSLQLHNEQRQSRSRRLPALISELVLDAKHWSSKERQGFYDEISKATEDTLIAEMHDSKDSICNAVDPLFESYNGEDPLQASHILTALRLSVPNQVSR